MSKVEDFIWATYKAVLWVTFGLIWVFIMALSHGGKSHGH